MERVMQYKCEFCKKIHTTEAEAIKCEAKCKQAMQTKADEQHKIAVIRNKAIELEKLIRDFIMTYGYDPRGSEGVKKLEKTIDDVKVKTVSSANEFLDFIAEVLENATKNK